MISAMQELLIRYAEFSDLDTVTALEGLCFPQAEAASRDSFSLRLKRFPECFWLAVSNGNVVSMINGMTTNSCDLTDDMYSGDSHYSPDGDRLMIFGVATHPLFQKQGAASQLMDHVIEQMKMQRRKGIVLTCKESLLPFYSRFGFVSEGVSASTHGSTTWYQMRLTFQDV